MVADDFWTGMEKILLFFSIGNILEENGRVNIDLAVPAPPLICYAVSLVAEELAASIPSAAHAILCHGMPTRQSIPCASCKAEDPFNASNLTDMPENLVMACPT